MRHLKFTQCYTSNIYQFQKKFKYDNEDSPEHVCLKNNCTELSLGEALLSPSLVLLRRITFSRGGPTSLKRKWERIGKQMLELDLQWELWEEKTLLGRCPHILAQKKWHKQHRRQRRAQEAVSSSAFFGIALRWISPVMKKPADSPTSPPSYSTLILTKSICFDTFRSCPFLFFTYQFLWTSIFVPSQSPFEFSCFMLIGEKNLHRNILKGVS